MTRGSARIDRLSQALSEAGLDALFCTLPTTILMVSGYWPVVGNAVAVVTRGGRVAVLAPEDEETLAKHGWATDLRTFAAGSLQRIISPEQALRDPLAGLLRDLGLSSAKIGYEGAALDEPATYSSVNVYGASVVSLLREAAPDATLVPLNDLITAQRAFLTPDELATERTACTAAADAFERGAAALKPGLTEAEVVPYFEEPMRTIGLAQDGVERAGGFVWCMSGPNSAQAKRAFAQTRTRVLEHGDFVLIHCNSYVDGYWTDVTRTYCLGQPDERQSAIYAAILAAREAALKAIAPGVRAADVDQAARAVIDAHGFGQYFPHGLGHSVGFSAINGGACPRLHPASDDVLEVGSTFNVEPSIYIDGYGAVRHCDVVTVGENGVEMLTPFHASIADLTIALT